MKCLFFVVLLTVCVVKCEDANYYVIRVPDEPRFKVYWNVPTMQCASKKIPFENLYQKYGIYQNNNDRFQGEKVTIMYDPGLFPALLKNETSGKFKFRNGGVPQEGDLDKHLEAFKKDLDYSVPDREFNGIGVIDFESWRPIFRQNFGVLQPYKDVSYEIERKIHWWWQKSWIEAEAKRRFESSARLFMQATIELARELRPKALWGFYGFPYCFNMASNNMVERCASQVPQENDRISWLWRSSTALYPSVYSSVSLTSSQLASLIKGRVKEARREGGKLPVLPYFWYRYRDASFLTKTDLLTALSTLYKSNASGFIIWGSSSDVNTADKCKKLLDYVERVLGPAVAKYTKISQRDEIDDISDDVTTETPLDVEMNTENNVNKTQDIKKQIEEDIRKKFTNYAPINEDNTSEEETAVLNNNVLVDLIINSILNNEINSFSNNSSTEDNLVNFTTESSPNDNEANSLTITNSIDSNSNKNKVIIVSTTDYYVDSTTESFGITDKDMEANKETTEFSEFSSTTEYNLPTENDFSVTSNKVQNSPLLQTSMTTESEVANIEYFTSTIDSKSTETSLIETTEIFNENINEQEDFFNIDTFNLDSTDATTDLNDDFNDKNTKKEFHNDINLKETNKATVNEITDQTIIENSKPDLTTESIESTTYHNTLNIETSTIIELAGTSIKTTDHTQFEDAARYVNERKNNRTSNNEFRKLDSTAITPTEDKVVVYVL